MAKKLNQEKKTSSQEKHSDGHKIDIDYVTAINL